MLFDFPYFSIVFIVVGFLAVIFAIEILLRPPSPGKIPFVIFLLGIAEWTIARTLEAGALDFADKVFWGRVMFFGSANTGVMWLAFSQDFSGSTWWKRPRNLILLYIVPCITWLVLWVGAWQSLIWTDIYPSPGTSGAILIYEHGPMFYAYGLYEYALVLIGVFILWRFVLHRQGIYRRQITALLIGTLFPVVGNVIYVLGFSPVRGLDLTPFGFAIAGSVYAVTIFRFRFLDLVPVARGALVENMPDGILVLDNESRIVDLNPAAEKLMGLRKASASGRRLEAIWPRLEIISSAIEPGTSTETALGDPKRYLEISVTWLRSSDNSASGKLVVLRDITDRRNMEQTLRESELRYSALVEQSNEGVLIVQDGMYKYANRTMAEIAGYPIEELMGKEWPFGVDEEDWDRAKERYSLQSKRKSVPEVYELRIKRKDGKKIEAEISVGIVMYEGQTAEMVTIRDISERKTTQRKIEALYNEERSLRNSLQEEIDKRSKYTRALIHELKTPLTAILASSEMLESEIHEKILSALVNNIRRASLNLEQRINELIELARGEIGMLKISLMPLNISELIRETISEMIPVSSAKGLALVYDISELPMVLGDRDRLRQVMINLLSNAIKFTNKGTITVTSSLYNNDFVITQIKDTGRGIEKKEMEHLFDPYRRQRIKEELGGLGIGLALSKLFVDMHKGKIWAESSATGSTFSFTIPIYKEKSETIEIDKNLTV
jgi:PAS domain S-box-containing protein